jgi:DUF438 domain-containing protein
MFSLEELQKQNREIAELYEILSVLIEYPALRGNPYACALVSQFNDKVWMHLVFEDNILYSELLRHHDTHAREIASGFRDSAAELRKRFVHYVKRWCQSSEAGKDDDGFIDESRKVLGMIMDRVRYENEVMFPLVEKHLQA